MTMNLEGVRGQARFSQKPKFALFFLSLLPTKQPKKQLGCDLIVNSLVRYMRVSVSLYAESVCLCVYVFVCVC